MHYEWVYDHQGIDWEALSELYRLAPLGKKRPEDLQRVFFNSMFQCFVYCEERLVGAGRALADGRDCSYLCDVAVHPEFQGNGLGKAIVTKLVNLSSGHNKIILYAAPGKENFYRQMGFRRLRTGMAIFEDEDQAIAGGLLEDNRPASDRPPADRPVSSQ